MPAPQQQIFARLHVEFLKSRGFRKLTNRSERSIGPIHQAVVCHSSRFNSPATIDFTLEFRVGHEEFFHLWQPGKPFPGLGETAFMPLLSWRPTEADPRIEKWWHLRGTQDLQEVQADVLHTFRAQGLPALDQTQSVEGVVQFCSARPARSLFQAHSWALHCVGRRAEAAMVVQAAIDSAPHENARKHALDWLAKLDA